MLPEFLPTGPPKQNLKLCLDLSETQTHIEAEGEVVWSSDSGRTGVRFQKISKESLQQLREWLFINNIVACANHSSFAVPAKTDIGAASESLEYSAPLLPDHTSALAAVAAINREVAALGPDVDAALQSISDRALSLMRATGAAIALAGSENMICRASSGADAPPVGAILQIGSGFSGECACSRAIAALRRFRNGFTCRPAELQGSGRALHDRRAYSVGRCREWAARSIFPSSPIFSLTPTKTSCNAWQKLSRKRFAAPLCLRVTPWKYR